MFGFQPGKTVCLPFAGREHLFAREFALFQSRLEPQRRGTASTDEILATDVAAVRRPAPASGSPELGEFARILQFDGAPVSGIDCGAL